MTDQTSLPKNQVFHAKPIAFGIIAVLFVTILPFLAIGGYLEPAIEEFVSSNWIKEHRFETAFLAIGLLISDVFLPIPSSGVCTLIGSMYGFFAGTLMAWTGLNLSAGLGYYLARWLGARALSRKQQIEFEQTNPSMEAVGPWYLLCCRSLPILAEASVLFAGLTNLSPSRFWPVVLGSNFGIAGAFAALGAYAKQSASLEFALAISISLPLGLTMIFLFRRNRLREGIRNSTEGNSPLREKQL